MSDAYNTEWYSDILDGDIEQLLHYTFKSTFKKDYLCPFNDSMEKCLDIGFSSGIWMMEMSSEFPKCQFYGIDPKPRSPDLVYPNNCSFEQEDYLKGISYPSNHFDVVHLRMILFPLNAEQSTHLLDEAIRVTKKGGFIEFLEPTFSPSSGLGPLSTKLFSLLTESPNNGQFCSQIDGFLSERGFTNIDTKKVAIPLGKWGSMAGEFSMATLKLVVSTSEYIRTELELHKEDDLKNFLEKVEKECEQYRPHVHILGGYAQKS